MKLNFKNVFLSVGIFAFALGVFGFIQTNKAEAAATTCTATTSGLWSDATTWDATCNGSDDAIPDADDAVVINNNIVVDVGIPAVAASVTLVNTGDGAGTRIDINSTTLTVTGAVTLDGPTTTGSSMIDVISAGTLSAGSLVINAGTSTGISTVRVDTLGSVDIAGNVSFSGDTAANARLTLNGTGNVYIAGNLGSGGVVNGTGGTVTFDAAAGAQTVAPYTFNNVVINNGDAALTVGLSGTTIIGGTLAVNDGILATADSVLTVTGATTVASGAVLSMSSATGLKTFTGDVTISGTWSETAAAVVNFAGSLTNNATSWTASTGIHTFSGATKTISGTTLTTIPNLTITGTISNTNSLTVSTALAGAGTLTNSATGILSLGFATTPVPTLVATAVGNSVIYTSAAPSCKVTAYDTLTFSGSGVVTCAVTTVADELVLSGTVSFTTSSNLSTNILTIGTGTTFINAAAYTLTAPTVTVTSTGTAANAGTMTVSTALSGDGTLTNTGTLNIGGSSGITGLVATTAPSIVNYTGAAQTVKAVHYYDLGLSGSGAKTIGDSHITNHLIVASTVSMILTDGGTPTTDGFKFGNSWKASGTWGGTSSAGPATHENGTYFTTAATGMLTVAHSHDGQTIVSPAVGGSSTTTTVETTTTTTTTPVVEPGCSAGNLFNTSTGKPCSNNTEVTSKKVYALGQTTLKNGSKGEAVMELQRFLNDKLSLGLVVDGKLGPKTIAVIKAWQKANGLVADGLVGTKTKALMNK